MKSILILILFFSLRAYSAQTCQNLFELSESTNQSAIPNLEVDHIIFQLFNLRLEIYSTENSSSLIAKNLFDEKLRDLTRYIPLDFILERLGSIDSKAASLVSKRVVPTSTPTKRDEIVNESILKIFLDENGFTSIDDKSRPLTPFHLASRQGRTDILRILIEKGVNPEEVFKDHTALMRSSSFSTGNDSLLYLLEKGVNPNTQIKGTSALTIAISFFNFSGVKILVERGADLELQDKKGDTALTLATMEANLLNIVDYLIAKGANINHQNNQGSTALMLAVIDSNEAVVQRLLNAGANVHLKDKKRRTALQLSKNKQNIRDLLKKYGARE